MKLSPEIEKELREYSKEMGWSEVEYIHYREFVINCAMLLKEDIILKRMKQLKIAA